VHVSAHRVACVLMQPACRRRRGVDEDSELEKTEDKREKGREQAGKGREEESFVRGEKRLSREERCLCTHQLAHICREDREHARQRPVDVIAQFTTLFMALLVQHRAAEPVVVAIIRDSRSGHAFGNAPAPRERVHVGVRASS
jgi:hypothetical protein